MKRFRGLVIDTIYCINIILKLAAALAAPD